MQQLLRTAVMHRTYEASNAPVQWCWFTDRIEIHNPGGLFGRTTEASFGKAGGNDCRRKACADNGPPPPELLFGPSSFGVIVRRRG